VKTFLSEKDKEGEKLAGLDNKKGEMEQAKGLTPFACCHIITL
jgi:hypothetical protein